MKKRSFFKILATIICVLLAIVLVGPFLVPVPPAPGTVPPQQLADPDSHFVEINGITVHYKIMGQGSPGPVFVLLHGFGASLYSWHAVMEPFSQSGTVIAYDRPAFGLTERPMTWKGQNPYSPQASVYLLLGILDHFNIQRAILVGNSAGGTVAMQFTLQHPERVQGLILVDPAVYEGGGGPSWLRPFYNTPEMNHLGPLIVRSIQKSGLDLIKMAWYDPAKIAQETWDGYTKPLKADNWDRALWYFTAASQVSDLPQRLGEFKLPILVITGDTDKIVPTANTIKLASALPNARLVIIPQAGHVPHEEQPGLFMQAVDEYLHKTLNLRH
jgi:pimeloyl-ACP methyl ester carboxylesterase